MQKWRTIPKDLRQQVYGAIGLPWELMVRVQLDFSKIPAIGSGALIAPRLILTCAHVVCNPFTGIISSKLAVQRYGAGQNAYLVPYEHIYIPDAYFDGIPYANKPNTKLWEDEAFLKNDYAILEVCKDLVPAGSKVFQYSDQADSQLNAAALYHLAFPANTGRPCRDVPQSSIVTRKQEPDWVGFPYKYCRGDLYRQPPGSAAGFAKSPYFFSAPFDVTAGHSGGPVYVETNGQYIIWGLMSMQTGWGHPVNYCHRLNVESVDWINSIVALTKNSPSCGKVAPLSLTANLGTSSPQQPRFDSSRRAQGRPRCLPK